MIKSLIGTAIAGLVMGVLLKKLVKDKTESTSATPV